MFIRPCVLCTQERWHSSNRTVPARDSGDYAVRQTNTKEYCGKAGWKNKNTVDFLRRKKGAIEIPRTIIHADILNQFDKRKLTDAQVFLFVIYAYMHVDTL